MCRSLSLPVQFQARFLRVYLDSMTVTQAVRSHLPCMRSKNKEHVLVCGTMVKPSTLYFMD